MVIFQYVRSLERGRNCSYKVTFNSDDATTLVLKRKRDDIRKEENHIVIISTYS
jgi:hypothetical protein